MRSKFDKQLDKLHGLMAEMSAEIEEIITVTTEALIAQDKELAYKAIAIDREIDNLEKEIESLCLKLLLLQQPVARDLRTISSALKMITDMERIGDQAADIAEISIILSKEQYIKKLVHIPQMAQATIKMVTDAVHAFVNNDLDLAKSVVVYDDAVDELFCQVRNDLVELIQKDSDNAWQALDLLMIAKYFERIGDHATNIAEWVEFSLTGEHKNERIV